MRVLKIEPGKKPEAVEIRNGLEEMQKIVGGYIQALYPFDDPVALVCGTMFLCGAPPDSEHFCSLTPEQIEKYEKQFHCPEVFLRTDRRIICLPMEE